MSRPSNDLDYAGRTVHSGSAHSSIIEASRSGVKYREDYLITYVSLK